RLRPSASPGPATSPSRPSAARWGRLPARQPTTGSPAAIASPQTVPKGSRRLGRAKRSASGYRAATCAAGTGAWGAKKVGFVVQARPLLGGHRAMDHPPAGQVGPGQPGPDPGAVAGVGPVVAGQVQGGQLIREAGAWLPQL